MKRVLLIVNPVAGKKQIKPNFFNIVTEMSDAGCQIVVKTTTGRGDATDFAYKAAKNDECDLIVCAGGDGTFNETLSGVLQSGNDKVELGYIPAGSTNDFANSLKIPLKPVAAVKSILKNEPTLIDVGKFNDRYFSYVASFGAFTKVSYTTSQDLKNVLGHMAYVLEGIKDLPTIRAEHIRLETENGSIDGDYIFGAICNSTSLGGILTINPDVVDMNDGLFEILLVRLPRNIIELNNIIFALNNHDYSGDMITFLSASHAEIFASAQMAWTLDGEFMNGSDKIVMQNIHDAIRIIVPGEK